MLSQCKTNLKLKHPVVNGLLCPVWQHAWHVIPHNLSSQRSHEYKSFVRKHPCFFFLVETASALVEGSFYERFCPTSSSAEDAVDFSCEDEEKNDVNRFGAAMFCQQILVPRSRLLSQPADFWVGNQINRSISHGWLQSTTRCRFKRLFPEFDIEPNRLRKRKIAPIWAHCQAKCGTFALRMRQNAEICASGNTLLLWQKKYHSARVQIAVAEIKILNSLQIMKIGERFLLVRQLCLAFFERNPYFFYLFLFFLRSHFLSVGFCTVYIRYRWPDTMCEVLKRWSGFTHWKDYILMLWLLVIAFDTLLIKLMQTAQLTFNGRTVTEFFAVLFLFHGIPMSWKGPRPAELSAIRNLLGSFPIFLGARVIPRYTRL